MFDVRRKLVGGFALTIIGGLIAIVCWGVVTPMVRARRLLLEVSTVDWSKQSHESTKDIVLQNGGYVDCDHVGTCTGYIEEYNKFLSRLRLAPQSGIRVAVAFDSAHSNPTGVATTVYSWNKKPSSVTLKQCTAGESGPELCSDRVKAIRIPKTNGIEVWYPPVQSGILRQIKVSCLASADGCDEDGWAGSILAKLTLEAGH